MIDRILAAAYPDASPMKLRGLYNVVDYDARPNRVVREAREGKRRPKLVKKPFEVPYLDDVSPPQLDEAYVWRVSGERLAFTRSLPLLAVMLVVAAVAIGLGWLFSANPLNPSEGPNLETAFVVGVIAFAIISYLRRWLPLVIELTMSMTDADMASRGVRTHAEIYQVAPSGLLTPQDIHSFTAEQLRGFRAAADAQGVAFDHIGNFSMEFLASHRTVQRVYKALRLNRLARHGLGMVMRGEVERVNGASHGVSYNPRDVTLVKLVQENVWISRVLPLVAAPVVCGAPFFLAAMVGALLDLDGSAILNLIIVVTGLFFTLVAGFWVLALFRILDGWLAGTDLGSQSGNTFFDPLNHRVRICSISGRWTTLLRTSQHAVAVEVYNLVARDIRKPAE